MTTLNTELLKLHQTEPFIELYVLDCTVIGRDDIYYFTNSADDSGSTIGFNGYTYLPMPIVTTGWEMNTSGTQPRPQVTIGNVAGALNSLGDVTNAAFHRIRTYRKFLDGMPDADGTAFVRPFELFYVYQKTSHSKKSITWQLASPVEAFGMQIPARQFLKDRGFPGISRIRGAA